ncbi:unnamed protein product, partial [Mesorhabditis belari]|uniref:Uncharacterized protein n=1 Tax=Mesorhabditis belari TaxID=2138241 RepID=A0AAF3JB65_9BILA
MDDSFCVNDLELTLLLWRLYAPKFDNRTFIRDEELKAVKSLEENINYHENWRIDEQTCKEELSKIIHNEKILSFLKSCQDEKSPKKIKLKDLQLAFSQEAFEKFSKRRPNGEKTSHLPFSKLSIRCAAERERCWIDETFGIDIESIPFPKNKRIDKDVSRELELLCGILSAALDQRDVWSACRLLQTIAPKSLPKLRKLATEKKMNIIQTLFSCTSNAEVEGSSCEDFSSDDAAILQALDRTVDQIQEHAHSATTSKYAVSQAIHCASQFAQRLDDFRNSSGRIKAAARALNSQLTIVEKLHENLKDQVNNGYQEPSKYITSVHTLVRSLFDRIYASEAIEIFQDTMTPAFKTPGSSSKKTPQAKQTQKSATTSEVVKESEQEKTPTSRHTLGLFLNNSTPTPIRTTVEALMDPLLDIEDDESESEGNKTIEEDNEKIKKKEFKRLNKRKSLNETPEARPAKAIRRRENEKTTKKALPTNQRTLLSFFMILLSISLFIPICPQILLPYGGLPVLQMKNLLLLSYYLPTSQSTGALVIFLKKLDDQIRQASKKSTDYVVQGSEDALRHVAAGSGYFDNPHKVRKHPIVFTGIAAIANKTIHQEANNALRKINSATNDALARINYGKNMAIRTLQDTISPYDVHHKMNVVVGRLQRDIEKCGDHLLDALKHFAITIDELIMKFDETGAL